jgi:hypothetical protein
MAAVGALLATVAAPVTATQPDPRPDGFHKVWICHRTLSETNPFVVIPVDIETWDAEQNGHNRPHNNAPDDFYLADVVKGEPKPSADRCSCDPGEPG